MTYFEENFFDEDLPQDTNGQDTDDDDDDDDDFNDDSEIVYLWESNGGCAICESMQYEEYEEEPEPPHILCNCTVKRVRKTKKPFCKRDYSITLLENGYSEHHFDIPKEERKSFTWHQEYIIHCPDGTDIYGEASVEIDYEDLYSWGIDFVGMLVNEVLNDIEDSLENECEPCQEYIISV